MWSKPALRVTTPRGARVRDDLNPSDVGGNYASLAYNVEFSSGKVGTRRAFKRYLPAQAALTESPKRLLEWINGGFRRLVQASATTLRVRDLATGAEQVMGARIGGASILTEFGSRLLVGEWSRAGAAPGLPDGASRPRVLSINSASLATFAFDEMWPAAPGGTVWNGQIAVGAGSQVVTPGSHNVVGIYSTRSGYQCRPIALGSWISTGGAWNSIRVTFPGGLDPQYTKFQFAVAPVATPSSYYIVASQFNSTAPAAGGSWTFIFDFDDATLQTHEPAPLLGNDFTQGDPYEVRPHAINTYGKRVMYHANIPGSFVGTSEGIVLASDSGTPQGVGITRSILRLPDRGIVTAGMEVDGVYYMFGHNSTHAIVDTNEDPVSWGVPNKVSSEIGALFQTAVAPSSKRAEGYIANPGGAHVVAGGRILSRPLSYWAQLDWKRINWSAPGDAFGWIDDSDRQRVGFAAPLDGALQSTHVLWWTYQATGRDGDYVINPDNVDYSIMPWPAFNAPGSYDTASAWTMALNNKLERELIFAPGQRVSGAWAMFRQDQLDAPYPWLDNGEWPIESIYDTAGISQDGVVWVGQGATLSLTAPMATSEGQVGQPQLEATLLSETPNIDGTPALVSIPLDVEKPRSVELKRTVRGEGIYLRLRGLSAWLLSGYSIYASPQTRRR
jgi:hypothetical protein